MTRRARSRTLPCDRRRPITLVASLSLVLSAAVPTRTAGQDWPTTGFEFGILPALGFDADEGFGYGVLAELYEYGDGSLPPYRWALQPTAKFTSEGRRDVTAFLDAPHVLPSGWRLDAFVGVEKHVATPYYGVGNETPYLPELEAEEGPDPHYYRFGRSRRSATFTLQRPVGPTPLRALFGAGIVRTRVDPFPFDEGGTLFARDFGASEEIGWSNYVRGGLVWDTRDRQTGPRRGSWTEFLIQWVDESLGADESFTRWTFTDRRYVPLGDPLVLANRWLLQGVGEGAPVYELFRVQTSYKQDEGLGGGKTTRGVLKNRFLGRGMLVWNLEARWRALELRIADRDLHVVLSAFVDHGRVWSEEVRLGELLSDLHRGWGGGLRLGMGENLTLAVDVGYSAEAGMPIYLGMGYLY